MYLWYIVYMSNSVHYQWDRRIQSCDDRRKWQFHWYFIGYGSKQYFWSSYARQLRQLHDLQHKMHSWRQLHNKSCPATTWGRLTHYSKPSQVIIIWPGRVIIWYFNWFSKQYLSLRGYSVGGGREEIRKGYSKKNMLLTFPNNRTTYIITKISGSNMSGACRL